MLLIAHLHITVNRSSLNEYTFARSLLFAQESFNNFSQFHNLRPQKLPHVNQFFLVVAVFLLKDRYHRQFLLQELKITGEIDLMFLFKAILL